MLRNPLLSPLINLLQKHLKHLPLHPAPLLIHLPDQPHDLLVALLLVRGEFRGDVDVGGRVDLFDAGLGGGVFAAVVFLRVKGRGILVEVEGMLIERRDSRQGLFAAPA